MRVLTKYILPAALVAGFLFFFIQTVFFDHYPNPDDYVYDHLVHRYGVAETIKLLFKIDTGRWFSHILVAISFHFLGHDFFRHGVYLSVTMLLFILAIAFVYKNYSRTFLRRTPTIAAQLAFSIISAAAIFFLLFAERAQSFGWVSSSINHLLSVTFCLLLSGVLFKETRSVLYLMFVLALSLAVGGSNEVNAICMMAYIAALFFFSLGFLEQARLNRLHMVLAIVFIALSIMLNLSSGGYEGRMNGLPSFNLYQSVKNTVHSFLMPFLNYLYLPFFLGALIVFILRFKQRTHHYGKKARWIFGATACLATLSFFLNCLLLSDVVPARATLWAYTLVMLTIGLFLASDKTSARPS